MIEIMTTLGIMSVLMVLFTGAILQVFKTTSAADALSEAQRELSNAFQRFDRELRYASWIGDPGTVGNRQYVEFAGPVPTTCYQLRLKPGTDGLGVLQMVTWTLGTPPAASATGQTIASQIDLTTGVAPFTKQGYGAKPYASASASPGGAIVGGDFTSVFQRLRVQLTTKVAAGDAQIDTTFTALNTSNQTLATNGCSEGRPTT
ncbi:hypothetical protein GCM10010435_53390 [Winogradskya consettensis]|uniref:Prepilin-type N-terminal cleavage/methylation domain-containing protein n=2 Tax=Winogradskya consettensis TaxID=113560 RepID=A0A919VW86_9ACTN|nr:hypothetical protein Aco04nite_26050 [Actinoplanes consettensis]